MEPRHTIVPSGDLRRERSEIGPEVDAAISRVTERGFYILGPEVAAFEAAFAEWCGARNAVGVASGTDALTVALAALEIPPGGEVVTSALTSIATATAIVRAGLRPVLCDVEADTLCIDPAQLDDRIGPQTRAVMPVHLYGRIAEVGDCKIPIVEDACQAHGASSGGRRAGTLGLLGCFSFYPSKNLGAWGDGGMITTNDDGLADRLRLLRQYGWRQRDRSELIGWCSRLDEIQAAVLSAKLPHLDSWNKRRAAIAAKYRAGLNGVPGIEPLPDAVGHCNHLFVVRARDRDRFRERLAERGIATAIHYPLPVHQHPGFKHLFEGETYPRAERACSEIVSLPMFPQLTAAEVDLVISAIRD